MRIQTQEARVYVMNSSEGPFFCICINNVVTKHYSTAEVIYLCESCGKELFINKEHIMHERLSDENLQRTQLVGEALEGKRGPDQKLIAEIGVAWIDTLLRKNMDYGSSVFHEPVLCPGLPTTTAIDVRMSDKIARIKNLKTSKAQVTEETVDDTYSDLGSYCLLRKVARTKEVQDGKDPRPAQQ